LLPIERANTRSGRALELDVGLAVDDDIGRVPRIALAADDLAVVEAGALAHKGEQLQLCRLNLGKERHAPEHLEFLL